MSTDMEGNNFQHYQHWRYIAILTTQPLERGELWEMGQMSGQCT